MTILETLTEEQRTQIDEAIDNITIPMLEKLGYGEEIQLTDKVTLSHYCEDDIIVVNLTEDWEEVLQVQWDIKERENIIFEAL